MDENPKLKNSPLAGARKIERRSLISRGGVGVLSRARHCGRARGSLVSRETSASARRFAVPPLSRFPNLSSEAIVSGEGEESRWTPWRTRSNWAINSNLARLTLPGGRFPLAWNLCYLAGRAFPACLEFVLPGRECVGGLTWKFGYQENLVTWKMCSFRGLPGIWVAWQVDAL